MFFLDIETLGTSQSAVVLSIGMIHLENQEDRSFQSILDSSLFLKLDSKSQIQSGRTVDKSTMEWWAKQGQTEKIKNLIPTQGDLLASDAILQTKKFISDRSKPKDRLTCFTRGSFDSMILDHLCVHTLGVDPLFKFWEYRDVRTAIDILYPETAVRSYVKIDESRCPGANKFMESKHSPDIDAALDAAMILYGV